MSGLQRLRQRTRRCLSNQCVHCGCQQDRYENMSTCGSSYGYLDRVAKNDDVVLAVECGVLVPPKKTPGCPAKLLKSSVLQQATARMNRRRAVSPPKGLRPLVLAP